MRAPPLPLAPLLTVLLLPGLAHADLPSPADATAIASQSAAARRLAADLASGLLTEHQARMTRFEALFAPDDLDPTYAGLAAPGGLCATDLLADLRAHWDEVPPEDRHRVEQLSSPIYRSWLADGGISWLQGDVDAARLAERSTCFSPETVNDDFGPYSRTLVSDHFDLRFSPTSEVTEDRAEQLLGWFEQSWQFQVVDRGFYQPWNLSQNEMLVVVEELNSDGIGAYATVAQCLGSSTGYMTYIVVNAWSFQDLAWLQSVAPHEFFHGVQIVYGAQEFWWGESDNRWLIEASATYMQRVVFPGIFGVEAQQAMRWSLEPYRSLETADDSGLQYGLVVFLLSLEESTGTNAWHQALWDRIYDRSGFDLREEFDAVLAEYDTDFLTEWRRFILRGAVGPLLDNPYLVSPLDIADRFNGQVPDPVIGRFDGRDYPLEEDIDSGSGHERPEYLGTNYVVFEGDRIEDDIGAVVRFRGEGHDSGEPVEWVVELAAVYNDSVRFTHSMVLAPQTDVGADEADVVGSVLINELGEDFDFVVMAVSPVTDFGDDGLTWSFTAELADSTGPGGFVPVPPEPDEEVPGTGCADCAASQGGARGGLVSAALLLPWLRRRRETSTC